jgi:hypothetical protein
LRGLPVVGIAIMENKLHVFYELSQSDVVMLLKIFFDFGEVHWLSDDVKVVFNSKGYRIHC